jgi:hypothetical protein
MTAVTGSYDDGEDVPTPDDGWADEHGELLTAVRAIADAALRLRVWRAVLVALGERVGR